METVLRNASGVLCEYFDKLAHYVDDTCQGLKPWQIVAYTAGIVLLLVWVREFLFQEKSLKERFLAWFFKLVRKLPIVGDKIQAEILKTSRGLENGFNKDMGHMPYVTQLPLEGYSKPKLLNELQKYRAIAKFDWTSGKASGTVYNGDPALTDLMATVYGMFAWTNPLHADVFPDVRKMEAEVVRMCCTLFNGGPNSCGCMSTGGTESILLAIKAYRDRAIDMGIRRPEMVVPVTAHAAFEKGAQYFQLKIHFIAVDSLTMKADVKAMKAAINKNTCMLVASTPQFPHGVMDPVKEIAALGLKYGIPVHVDACLGGFLIPFMKKAGYSLEPFDFSVQGVTSISADTHKYGFAPKGSSVILYSDPSYRKFQFFVSANWPGGVYATATFSGSRAGAIIAACWATMMTIGEQGYVDSTRAIISTTRYIKEQLRDIKGIFLFGDPEVSVVSVGSLDFNIYRLSDAMTSKGWSLNVLQFPSSFHLCITLLQTKEGVADQFLQDVRDCTSEIMKDPRAKCGGMGAIYGMSQSIPDRSLIKEIGSCFLDAVYNTSGGQSNGAEQ